MLPASSGALPPLRPPGEALFATLPRHPRRLPPLEGWGKTATAPSGRRMT
ncbi:hypothetical protein [Geobacillus subterraneus]|nr:hypothetical protein [Geobacillus subterraneus]